MVYQVINKILEQGDIGCSAAEAHGMATGMLCVNEKARGEAWMAELLNDAEPLSDEYKDLLARLFDETARLMSNNEFEFDLLLPADEVALSFRIEALKNWCHGFLFGVGAVYSNQECSRDASEILKDIAEFTKLETDAEGEEDENAFMEVTEYLRSAVLLLRDELVNNTRNTLH